MENADKIKAYCDLLSKWNEKINLVSGSSIEDIMDRHIHDCLQLASYLPNKNARILDLGTGAGLPGVILAMEGYINLTLVDADQKKCVFLREVRRQLGLNFDIINVRIEDLDPKGYDIIVSRALASLDKILDLALPLIEDSTKLLLLKGRSYEEEINLANDKWRFDFIAHPSKTGCGGVVLEVQNIKKL